MKHLPSLGRRSTLIALCLAAGCQSGGEAEGAAENAAVGAGAQAAEVAPAPEPKAAQPSPAERVAARRKAAEVASVADKPLQEADEEEEVELYSAQLTAYPCAVRAAKEGTAVIGPECSPMEAVTHGFALLDPQEKKVFLVKEGSVYRFELEHGFGGRVDISGNVVGTRGGVPVIAPESYTITPKPKAGAFKGCL
ncbi:MAG: hypothetical protein H6747_01410 [Deltaproteobacteria bacterium]|nr:hypothetical protein [Deltaproteobacteria bacterium]